MRDVETISIALEASETGHLVLSTLHTIDASKTIDRIVGVFPKNEERQVRTRFSQAFRWVVSQRLIPKQGGGRMAICEILRSNSRTKEYVQEGEREGKSLADAMADGALDGMQTFDGELERLIGVGRARPGDRAQLRDQPHQPPAPAGDPGQRQPASRASPRSS